MLEKKDILLLLTDLQEKGVDVSEEITTLYSNNNSLFDILKKINENKNLDLVLFYEKLRKSYNKKSSKLYINIVKCDENLQDDPKTIITTLTALLNQITQFECDDYRLFYKASRAEEILLVLNSYFKNYNLEPAIKLLSLIKADLVASEYINNRRLLN